MNWNWKNPSLWQRLLVALLIVAAASAFRAVFFGSQGKGIPYLLYYPAVTLAALFGGLSAGFVATALSALLIFLWIQERSMSPVESLALTIFVISCTLISSVCGAMRRANVRAKVAQEKTEATNLELRREGAERKREEEKMRRMATVVRDSNDAITIQDFEGRITAWNRGAELMDGYSEAEALAANIERLTAPGKVAEQKDFIRRLIAGVAITSFETQRVTKDRRVLDVWMTVTKLMDEAGNPVGLASTERDITARKRLEAESAATLEKEHQLSEMKTRFISVTSHEFRTPMAAAMGSVEILANHLDRLAPAKRRELLDRITSSLHRMTVMLDEILLLNRMDANRVTVRLTSVDLHQFAQNVLEEIRLGDRDAHRFELSATGETAAVETDPNLLHHMLSNLLSNAARYSPAGTLVTLRLAVASGRTQIAVEDQGIGVPAADRARIFESFERGSNVGTVKGTGRGLNIVQRMAGLLGGTVALAAAEGGGSCFTLDLPLHPTPALSP